MSTVITATVKDTALKKGFSPHIFTMSDGNRIVIYQESTLGRPRYRIYAGGVWGAESLLTGALGPTSGNVNLGIEAVQVANAIYFVSPRATASIVTKFAYAAGAVVQSEVAVTFANSSGVQRTMGIVYDSVNGLIHVGYQRLNGANTDQHLEAFTLALVSQYTVVVSTPGVGSKDEDNSGLISNGGTALLYYYDDPDNNTSSVYPVTAGAGAYVVGAMETTPSNPAPGSDFTAGFQGAWDGTDFTFVATVSDNTSVGHVAKLTTMRRTGLNTYTAYTTIITGSRTFTGAFGTYSLARVGSQMYFVAVRRLTTVSDFDVVYMVRSGGSWPAAFTVLDTGAAGRWGPGFGVSAAAVTFLWEEGGTVVEGVQGPSLTSSPVNLVELSVSLSECAVDTDYVAPVLGPAVSDPFTGTARTSAPRSGTAGANY